MIIMFCSMVLNVIDSIAVSGCQYGDDDDPGNLEFDWLEVQLKQFRDKNIQVSMRLNLESGSRMTDANKIAFFPAGVSYGWVTFARALSCLMSDNRTYSSFTGKLLP